MSSTSRPSDDPILAAMTIKLRQEVSGGADVMGNLGAIMKVAGLTVVSIDRLFPDDPDPELTTLWSARVRGSHRLIAQVVQRLQRVEAVEYVHVAPPRAILQ